MLHILKSDALTVPLGTVKFARTWELGKLVFVNLQFLVKIVPVPFVKTPWTIITRVGPSATVGAVKLMEISVYTVVLNEVKLSIVSNVDPGAFTLSFTSVAVPNIVLTVNVHKLLGLLLATLYCNQEPDGYVRVW